MIAIFTEIGRLAVQLLELWGVAKKAPRLSDAEIQAEIGRIRKAYADDDAEIARIRGGGS